MSQQAPKMYREINQAGVLKEHLTEIADEAQEMYEATLNRLKTTQAMGDEAQFIAAEIVFAEMIQFPGTQEKIY
ncbi:MAG: hypothetical protein ACXW30_05665 [Micavibrio sp.]